MLKAQDNASSEFALTTWVDTRKNLRMDRIFHAGATPLATGKEYLWIVDYKTTTYGSEEIEAFLMAERSKYNAQMETYAQMFDRSPDKIRLALYYPLLPKLIWWAPGS